MKRQPGYRRVGGELFLAKRNEISAGHADLLRFGSAQRSNIVVFVIGCVACSATEPGSNVSDSEPQCEATENQYEE
jgi:hypothetical protein